MSKPQLITVYVDWGTGEFAYSVYDTSLDAVLADAKATYPEALYISLSVGERKEDK